jgi:hypothetical protein
MNFAFENDERYSRHELAAAAEDPAQINFYHEGTKGAKPSPFEFFVSSW